MPNVLSLPDNAVLWSMGIIIECRATGKHMDNNSKSSEIEWLFLELALERCKSLELPGRQQITGHGSIALREAQQFVEKHKEYLKGGGKA